MRESNPQGPHVVVCWVQIDVYESFPTGEVSGRHVRKPVRFPLRISAANRDDALEKADLLAKDIKQLCITP